MKLGREIKFLRTTSVIRLVLQPGKIHPVLQLRMTSRPICSCSHWSELDKQSNWIFTPDMMDSPHCNCSKKQQRETFWSSFVDGGSGRRWLAVHPRLSSVSDQRNQGTKAQLVDLCSFLRCSVLWMFHRRSLNGLMAASYQRKSFTKWLVPTQSL